MSHTSKKEEDMFPCESRTSTPEYRINYDDIKWEVGTLDEPVEYKEEEDAE